MADFGSRRGLGSSVPLHASPNIHNQASLRRLLYRAYVQGRIQDAVVCPGTTVVGFEIAGLRALMALAGKRYS
jgi:hypothetical protein